MIFHGIIQQLNKIEAEIEKLLFQGRALLLSSDVYHTLAKLSGQYQYTSKNKKRC